MLSAPMSRLTVVAVAYFAASRLGPSLVSTNASVSALWAPAGIALAAVLVWGYRMWPAIWVAAFLAAFTHAPHLGVDLGIATGSTLAALCGAYLLNRVEFRHDIDRIRDVLALTVLAALVSTIVGATIGVLSLRLGGLVSVGDLWPTWRLWWLRDACSVLVVASTVLVLSVQRIRHLDPWRLVEAAVLAALLVGATLAAYLPSPTVIFPHVTFPLLFWASLRFRQLGAVLGSLMIAVLAVWLTAEGHGPYQGGAIDAAVLRAQGFAAVSVLSALLVAAARTAWDRAEEVSARLAEAQSVAAVGSWEWDIPADEVTWSDELYRIYGVDETTFGASYEGFLELVHPDDRAMADAMVRRAFETGERFQFQHRTVRPDGSVRVIQATGDIIRDSGGSPVLMRGTGQDVTEAVLAETRFRGLLEAAPDAMVVVNERGEIVLVNSQTEELFGYEAGELIGQRVERLIPERFHVAHEGHRDGYAAEPHPRPMGAGLDLFARRKGGSEFPVEISLSPLATDEGMLVTAAVRDVTMRKLTEEKLEYQALHDPLTALPNRALLLDRLDHALRRARRSRSVLAVLFCDLDEFKEVNDTLGHDAGDRLLTALTPRLREALRPGDTIARFGGDEFVILCEDLTEEADAGRIAERIAKVSERPIFIGTEDHFLTISVGIVVIEAGAANASDVLRDADAAMYRAKAKGGDRYEIFDDAMRERLLNRMETEAELRRAIAVGEFSLVYQPVIWLADGSIFGAEALLRWNHPQRGTLAPGEFLDTAEERGLILPIGDWVIQQTVRQAAEWQRRFQGLCVSLNLSSRQIARTDLPGKVVEAITETGADPTQLGLEITESALLDESQVSLMTLRSLKGLGAKLVLDDFGTGYSSLSHLRRHPIDAVKIDRSFIAGLGREPGDLAIVSAVLGLTNTLGIRAIAEGIETEDQLQVLRRHGCLLAQGYYFSPPVPPDEMTAMLADTGVVRPVPADRIESAAV